MKTVLLCFTLGLFFSSPLFSQQDDVKEPPKAAGRVAWFVSTSMPDGLENPVSLMTGAEIIKLTISKRAASEPVKIPADGILRMVRKVENPEDPAKPKLLILAQANIPEGVGKALVILVPAAKNPNGLLFQAKVQDLASFKGGDFLYLNLTNREIGVELGTTAMKIKPGETKIYDAPVLAQPLNVPVRYSYYQAEKEQWNMLSASTIVLRATRREICIFSWDPNFDRIDYHGITFPVTP